MEDPKLFNKSSLIVVSGEIADDPWNNGIYNFAPEDLEYFADALAELLFTMI